MVNNSKSIPSDKVNLKLIFVAANDQAGKEFLISPSLTASDISKHVFENWPPEWSANRVERPEVLRLIYQGRFLHENVSLNSLNVQPGRTCVMHLVPREKIPEPTVDTLNKEKSQADSSGCCCMCSIL